MQPKRSEEGTEPSSGPATWTAVLVLVAAAATNVTACSGGGDSSTDPFPYDATKAYPVGHPCRDPGAGACTQFIHLFDGGAAPMPPPDAGPSEEGQRTMCGPCNG
jgi:hypothetical protein